METDAKASDDDARGQGKHTVLWEKCIEQSIFVDLSEGESLDLSELERSLVLRVSQAESAASVPSIHLSEHADLSDVPSSEPSVDGQSDGAVEDQSCVLQPHAQHPHRTRRFDNSDQNTSDEEQEELPYDGKEAVNASPDGPGSFEPHTGSKDDVAGDRKKGNLVASSPADIHQLLLRHFPQEELLQPDMLIQAETLPEVSLLESAGDTGGSSASARSSTSTDSDRSRGSASDPEIPKSEEKNPGSEGNGDSNTSSTADSMTLSSEGGGNSTVVDVSKQEQAAEMKIPRVPLLRMRSFTDMKYGQGQVHYPLPDFSKISPKVKIPKGPSGPARPAPKTAGAMHRTRSSPDVLEVISRVLEDSGQTSEHPHELRDADRTPPAPAHQQQAKPPPGGTPDEGAGGALQRRASTVEGRHLESCLSLSGERSPQRNDREPKEAPSDGERMTAELRDIACQFVQKVEDFKRSVSHMSISTTEQQAMLRCIMEAQDQLERRYMSKKEEHRALEMQNYMGLSRNTGTFDSNRHVEGDIFRIGMHLEDIKEMIDRNVREQISPLRSSSTPTPVKDVLDMEPLCMSTPLPLSSPCEASSTDFSTLHYKAEGENEVTNKNVPSQTSSGVTTSAPSPRNGRRSGSTSRRLYASVEELGILAVEADEEMSCALSEALDHSNILEYLSGAKLPSRQSPRTPGSCSASEAVLDVCDRAVEASSSDAASLPEPPVKTSPFSSQIVRAETDSGFGSSYLIQTGLFQPTMLAGRPQPLDDGPSNSEKEGSCSNVQTVRSVVTTGQGLDSPQHSGVAVGVEQWVEDTTKMSSLRLQEQTRAKHRPQAQLHHRVSDPVLNATAAAGEGGSQLHSCSCNSEAILTLQSEVSRLREDLQGCLVLLPHLAQEMGHLNSERERGSKTRTGSHHRSSCNRTRHDRSSLGSSQVTIEDWISADMDQTKYTEDKTKQGVPDIYAKRQPQTSIMESFYSKDRRRLFSSGYLQKPLLQVNYGSSNSLPASYKIREPSVQQSTSHHRKRSTQSDTALLPSDVYFQRTPSPLAVADSKAGTSRSKEEDIVMSLDRAIKLARKMKRTTEKMAKRLSVDLPRTHPHSKPANTRPLGGSKRGPL